MIISASVSGNIATISRERRTSASERALDPSTLRVVETVIVTFSETQAPSVDVNLIPSKW